MPKRSIELGEMRLERITRLAADLEIGLEECILRLVDGGLASHPPIVPQHLAHLLIPPAPTATETAVGEPTKNSGSQAGPAPGAVLRAELQWREDEVWAAHIRARRKHAANKGLPSESFRPPQKTPELVAMIRAALKAHDGDLLGPESREAWKEQSHVRAAAIGIFLSPWHCGEEERNRTEYLEPWRCFKAVDGKDPVPTFSTLYIEQRAARRGELS